VKKILLCLLALSLVAGFTACAQPLSAGEFIQSDKPRETSPQVDETDLETLVNGNSEFAFDLYQALSQQDGNIFYSPYSISLALAMTYAGARGQTEEQKSNGKRYSPLPDIYILIDKNSQETGNSKSQR